MQMNASTITALKFGDKSPGVERESAEFYILHLPPGEKDDQLRVLHPMLDLSSNALRLSDKDGNVLWRAP
jgi:hypothetical protein